MTAESRSTTSSLVPAIAQGDASALEALYDRYSPILYALLLRILGRPEDAQEVLQEAFVQVWRRASSFDSSRGSEAAWLISIARSRGIDRLRARRIRDERESEAGREISTGGSSVEKTTGQEHAIFAEERRAVRAALAELPDNQRIPLELAYFEGLTQSEIATRLNEPLGTIKTRIQLGMKKLRERLAPTIR